MPLNEAQILGLVRGPTTEQVLEQISITVAGYPGASVVHTYFAAHFPRNGKDGMKVSSNALALGPGAAPVQAHSIQMVAHANTPPLNQIPGYLLDGNGPDLMLTGMLNGCSFIMKANANRSTVRCAHLQPVPGVGHGAALNVRCINNAAFLGDAGPVTVFGRNNYADVGASPRSCTVLGVRRAGAWEIYAQIFNSATFEVVSATRIL
jgi:hypothetical protein